jgi:predicted O-methyltransferase YrrM
MADPERKPAPGLPTCDDKRLWEVWLSYYHFPTLTVADDLGLFNLLDRRPLRLEAIGAALGLSPRAAEALVGVVTALGFLSQHEGLFHLTEVSRNFLLPSSPFYWGGMLHFARSVPVGHEDLKKAIQNDRPREGTMEEMWEVHEMEPDRARAFTSAMHSRSVHLGTAAARRVAGFGTAKRLLDVAGGSGVFSIAIAREHPHIRCTVLELPRVADLAREYIAQAGVGDRVDTCVANMWKDPWPAGYDALFFSNIYHDWDRARCLHLTQKGLEALPRGGRLYIHEVLLADTKDAPLVGVSDSMLMMFFTEGKQRTAGEFASILTEAGFRDPRVIPTHGYYSVIEATKP